jgi:spore germination protein YaaH
LRDVTPEHLGALVAASAPPTARPPAGSGSSDRRRTFIAAGTAAVVAIVALALVVFGGGGDEAPPRLPGALNVHAWTPFWALDDALPELEARSNSLHQVSPFWYRASDVDTIEVEPNTPTEEADRFLELARDRGVPLVASVLDGTDAGVMAAILADPAERARHVEALAAFAADGDFDGIDIDYEQFAFADSRDSWVTTRPNWVAFVTELSARLHGDGRTLTVSVPPVYDAGQTEDSGYWVYDYAAIAPLVDSVRVMAYDYSNASTDPGPVAPLDWVDRLIAGTSAAAGDPSKLVLGIPLYGYNWPISTTGECPPDAPDVTTVTNRTVDALATDRGATPVFDPVTYEWSFQYELQIDNGATACTQLRQVNYVGADGAQQRMQRAVDAGFGGVALFAFGYEDDAVWTAVDTIAAQLAPPTTTTT